MKWENQRTNIMIVMMMMKTHIIVRAYKEKINAHMMDIVTQIMKAAEVAEVVAAEAAAEEAVKVTVPTLTLHCQSQCKCMHAYKNNKNVINLEKRVRKRK